MVPGGRKPTHQARSHDPLPPLQCGMEQEIRTMGGVVLGARVELEQPACPAEMPCPWPHMTQVQLSVWEVQDRNGVWKERTGRKGWGNTSMSTKRAPGPTVGKGREGGDFRHQGIGLFEVFPDTPKPLQQPWEDLLSLGKRRDKLGREEKIGA